MSIASGGNTAICTSASCTVRDFSSSVIVERWSGEVGVERLGWVVEGKADKFGCVQCPDAYPVGDMTGCGDDAPVKATSSGDKTFDSTFAFFPSFRSRFSSRGLFIVFLTPHSTRYRSAAVRMMA